MLLGQFWQNTLTAESVDFGRVEEDVLLELGILGEIAGAFDDKIITSRFY